MLHQKNKEALQDKQLKDKNRAVAKRENEREMLRKKQQNMQVNSYEPETEMVEAVSPADANKEKMLQKKQLMLNRQKLQLQTKAVNSGQKTDMSLRKEEQMKGNKDVSINPKVGGTCPKDGGMIIDGVCQECGGKAKNESYTIGEDSRRTSNKQQTKRVRSNIKSFGSNYTPPNNWDPDANRGQGEVVTRKQMEKKRRKSLRQEEVEAIEERSLSKGEEKEKEKNVKGMKKSFSDFKKRYGDDAKSVMYATATKMAKEETEIDEKFATQYGDKTKLSQSSKRKSLGRGSSIKDGAKKTGYESPAEFRSAERKFNEEEKPCIDKDKKTKHNCAKKVCSEQWGVGDCIYGQHAVPDADGNVAWYDVMFEHGVERNVPSAEMQVLVSESHNEHVEHQGLDERTRYAKETGKDFKTGNPSEKGGKEPAPALKSVKDYMRKTGGAMSSRGKAIAIRGKKKDKGAKPKFKSEPTPVDKIKGKLAKKRAPKPDIGSRFD